MDKIMAAACPISPEVLVPPLTRPVLPWPPKQKEETAPPAPIVTPGSQSFIHIAKDFAGTPGTNPNPCRCTPPDMGLAASSKFVVQMVNLAGTIWKNNGVAGRNFSLADFLFLPV